MVDFVNLPLITLEKIFLYLSYDEIARCRLVCKRVDAICRNLLTKGFLAVENYHSQCLKTVKAQLPRRESERRNHALSRHCDILTAIETRLSMLAMTFMKYIEIGLCCFIPGKVIDEIYRVLWFVQKSKNLPRAHDILQELRDISSMAIEHFDENIVPGLKQSLGLNSLRNTTTGSSNYSFAGGHTDFMVSTASHRILASRKLHVLQQRMLMSFKKNQAVVVNLKNSVTYLKSKIKKQNVQIIRQITKIREQEAKLSDHTAQLADLRKHIEEYDRKFAALSAELAQARGISVAADLTLPVVDDHPALPVSLKLDNSESESIGKNLVEPCMPASLELGESVDSEVMEDEDSKSSRNFASKRKALDDMPGPSGKHLKL
ncbi:F-box only protein 28 isoform X2 [Ischnura elegans]|uniref:F-box only protein 28 isoform X2 n=1 Tax=Ischnura elegans TaxID=197161 RepID=UPI001ED89742|nr:F-box only protein 28 isoform X2 [Ischnura elegans]